MERTLITRIIPGTEVKVQGFVERVRNTGAMAFLVLRDRTGKVQVTIEK
ncbi:MAG TPA: OB-fold nucleic acid binding domain-containing protein, partial [Clostridia bacterium]|nr:OB-fold nucleic acid binding domain-containing protein [Clostridia bacterium]